MDAAKRRLIDRVVELGRKLGYTANEKQIRKHASHFTLEELEQEVATLEKEKDDGT